MAFVSLRRPPRDKNENSRRQVWTPTLARPHERSTRKGQVERILNERTVDPHVTTCHALKDEKISSALSTRAERSLTTDDPIRIGIPSDQREPGISLHLEATARFVAQTLLSVRLRPSPSHQLPRPRKNHWKRPALFVGARYIVPGADAWLSVRPFTVRADPDTVWVKAWALRPTEHTPTSRGFSLGILHVTVTHNSPN